MLNKQIFSKASDKLFLIAMVLGKGANIKHPLIGHICFILSTILYLLAYSAWQIAIYLQPNIESKIDILPQDIRCNYNKEYSACAILGIVSSIIALSSLAIPICSLIAAWLFLASNACWCAAEWKVYYQSQSLSLSVNAAKKQNQTVSYVTAATGASLTSSLYLTLGALFAPFITSIASQLLFISIVALNIYAFYKLCCSVYYGRKLNNEDSPLTNKDSYNKMLEKIPKEAKEIINELEHAIPIDTKATQTVSMQEALNPSPNHAPSRLSLGSMQC